MINNKEIYKLQKDVKDLQDAPPVEVPDIDLSNYYTKPQVDSKIPPKDFGSFTIVNVESLGIKYPKNYNQAVGTFIIMDDGPNTGWDRYWFVSNPTVQFQYNVVRGEYFRSSTLDFSGSRSDGVTNVFSINDGDTKLYFSNNADCLKLLKDKNALHYSEIGGTIHPYEQQQAKANDADLSKYTGKNGQLVANTETKRLHLMDGTTNGGTVIPNMEDLNKIQPFDLDWGEVLAETSVIFPNNFDKENHYFAYGFSRRSFEIHGKGHKLAVVRKDMVNAKDQIGINGGSIDTPNRYESVSVDFSTSTLKGEDMSVIPLVNDIIIETNLPELITKYKKAQKDNSRLIAKMVFKEVPSELNKVLSVKNTRGENVNISNYLGVEGQLVVNTTSKSLHVMDGVTPGGTELAKAGEAYSKNETYNKHEIDGRISPEDYGTITHAFSDLQLPGSFTGDTDWFVEFRYDDTENSDRMLYSDLVVHDTYSNSYRGAYWRNSPASLDFSNTRRTYASQIGVTSIGIYIASSEAMRASLIKESASPENITVVDYFSQVRLFERQQLKGNDDVVKEYLGRRGQIVYNETTGTLHAMDGTVKGGKALATKEELDTVFQSVSSGKSKVETAITGKGGTVSKVGQVATFDELVTAINTIVLSDPDHVCREDGKQELLDMMISKLPSLESKLTIDSSLHDFAYYLNMIGEMLFAFREIFSAIPIDSVAGVLDPVVLEQFQAIMDMNVMEDQHTPFTEIFEAFTIPDVSGNITPVTLSTTIVEKIEVTEEAFGHVLYFRNNTSYMFTMNKMNFELGEDYVRLKTNHVLTAEDSNGIKVININMEDFNKIVQMEVEI